MRCAGQGDRAAHVAHVALIDSVASWSLDVGTGLAPICPCYNVSRSLRGLMLERALSSLSRPSLAAHWVPVSSLPFFPSISYPIPPSLALPWSDYSVHLHPRSHTACLASRAACACPFQGLHTACLASRAVCACSLVPTAAHRMPRLTYCMHVLTPMPALLEIQPQATYDVRRHYLDYLSSTMTHLTYIVILHAFLILASIAHLVYIKLYKYGLFCPPAIQSFHSG